MTLATQAAADFLTFDGLEAVTLIARRTDANGNPFETRISIAYALRRAVGFRDRSLGLISTDDVGTVWHVRRQDIVEPVSAAILRPQRGDGILDANGDHWGIRSMELQTLSTRWRLVCALGEL